MAQTVSTTYAIIHSHIKSTSIALSLYEKLHASEITYSD